MKEKIKVTQIIHLAMCLGLIFAYSIIGDINSLTSFSTESINASNIIYS